MTSLVISRLSLTVLAVAATTALTSIFGSGGSSIAVNDKSTLRQSLEVNPIYPSTSDGTTTIKPTLYTSEALADQITSLPGLNYNHGFNQFSGYFKVSEHYNRNIFYWYVESQNDPENDPVVFWTNGTCLCVLGNRI